MTEIQKILIELAQIGRQKAELERQTLALMEKLLACAEGGDSR